MDSLDQPSQEDLALLETQDLGNPMIDSLYTEILPQVVDNDLHLKVMAFAKRISEKYEPMEFNKDVRKLPTALNSQRLNSVEQAILLVAILRKDRIPARLVLGYSFDRPSGDPAMSFHAWVEYHNQTWWWPIDPVQPTKAGLLDRIKLREISKITPDLRRDITKILELSNDGTITFQD